MDMNVKQLPQHGEDWLHHGGKEYKIITVTNTAALDHDKFPVTVVYQGHDGNIWSRPANSFLRKFTRCTPANKA